MSLRLFIGGMRGSRPVTGCAFAEFGGDTTSLLVVGSGGERLVLDAGTGMHAVAEVCSVPVRACPEPAEGASEETPHGVTTNETTILFSHYHLDHIAGLTMNPLFYRPDWSFRFVGPTFADGGVRDAVTRLVAPPYWPITLAKMIARCEFAEFATDEIRIGRLRVRRCLVPHPGGCLAYRIDDTDAGAALVFATDLEWRERTDAHETAFLTMCREPGPADVLAIDAHFARENGKAFAGWGHSSWQDGLEIAAAAGIRQVLLGHHAPDADDQALRVVEQQVQKCSPGSMLARAGQWLTIGR